MIASLDELGGAALASAGGKAATLARLKQAGHAVPDGFLLLPDAFDGDDLRPAAWTTVRREWARLGGVPLAVRSSARAEDGATASFAGEFETVLDVRDESALRAAVQGVRASGRSARVVAYSLAQGAPADHDLAVLVQRLVAADISGVLFTADPVSGSHARMVGNYVHGAGEALVGGDADPETFSLRRPGGQYEGAPVLRRWARRLFQLGCDLEERLGAPQDIEWAIADGRLWLLQSRPITTLRGHDPATGEWNDSLRGDYLWTTTNFGEAVPDVMTPATWSMLQIYGGAVMPIAIPGHPAIGNIGGRLYFNIALFFSIFATFGLNPRRLLGSQSDLFGRVPDDVALPIVPLPRLATLRRFLPAAMRARRRVVRQRRELPAFVAGNPTAVENLVAAINAADTPSALRALWADDLGPRFRLAGQYVQAATGQHQDSDTPLRRRLSALVGAADANALLTGGDAPLPTLAPLIGLAQVARGELSPEAYHDQFGHRGPHEVELSAPRPAEAPGWLDEQRRQLAEVDVDGLLAAQATARAAAGERLARTQPPRVARKLLARLAVVAANAHWREATRSEFVRLVGVIRAYYQRAGVLTGQGDDLFFLSLDELDNFLAGDGATLTPISARRATHARYAALPPYPAIIRGRFDPFQWAADPRRRPDVYDAQAPASPLDETASLRGFPGAAGVVEGRVRRLDAFEEGAALQPGEILVAAATNVGWTPLFPRAAAVVTDVGAPLSHAAIVARELGIPAVVGTGTATQRLRTGDWVRVDGGRGTVERFDPIPEDRGE